MMSTSCIWQPVVEQLQNSGFYFSDCERLRDLEVIVYLTVNGLLRNLGFYLYHCIFVNHDTMILSLNKIAYNFNQNNQ